MHGSSVRHGWWDSWALAEVCALLGALLVEIMSQIGDKDRRGAINHLLDQ